MNDQDVYNQKDDNNHHEIYRSQIVNILLKCCRHSIEISSTFYQDLIDILSRFCQYFIEISLIF